jgi:hypothetical protein
MTSNLTPKSFCQKYGHIWVSTTSPTVRQCHRCRATMHFALDGEWHLDEVPAHVAVASGETQPSQQTLF